MMTNARLTLRRQFDQSESSIAALDQSQLRISSVGPMMAARPGKEANDGAEALGRLQVLEGEIGFCGHCGSKGRL